MQGCVYPRNRIVRAAAAGWSCSYKKLEFPDGSWYDERVEGCCPAAEIGGRKEMVSQKVVIKNPTGLHLRPAGILCKEAMQFKSLITFSFRENTANAKSVLSVLGACVKCGDEIEFVCEGEDEKEALETLVRAVEDGLGE